ncbi:hypothetical protein N9S81_00295 [bacterium]|nr:hypothetical protein [bacterium]
MKEEPAGMQTRNRQSVHATPGTHTAPPLTFLGKGIDTGGALFNRKDPQNAAGEVVPILDRNGEPKGDDVHNFFYNEGRDVTGLKDRSRWKYRIPSDSIVNMVGDISICGVRPTLAQWVFFMNLICFLVHTAAFVLTLWFAYFRKDMTVYGDEDPYEIRIFKLSAKWNNNTRDGYEITVVDNNMPINVAWMVMAFFLLSAIAHLWAIIAGAFECFWFLYWRQMDDAFCFWRWIEYSGSCSVMSLLIATSIGIREQNTLSLIFVSQFVTMMLGWMTELYSRPVIRQDKTSYSTPMGRLGFLNQPDYTNNPNSLHLLSKDVWVSTTLHQHAAATVLSAVTLTTCGCVRLQEGDRPIRDEDGKVVVPKEGTRDYR